ncbi:MAG: glutamine-hydrolyzing GMP synthase [Bacillota bacterium]|nr:MAG: glutamine-hydrolyzing GMP synthase [Bacillota bacterium]
MAASELVLVLDFGAQYSQLIARRVREHHVYCELVPHSLPMSELLARRPRAVILSGGPASVYGDGAPRYDPALFDSGVPILGICYGMQLMAFLLGGRVVRGERREYGRTLLMVDEPEVGPALFAGIERRTECWMSHGDLVLEPPPGFEVLAHTENSPVAAFADKRRRLYGVQFHPEVVHTPRGRDIMGNFLFGVAGLGPTWTPGSMVEAGVRQVAAAVGDGRAIVALSGGVDSAVAAAMAHRALGDRLTAVFVDHGLLRKDEPGMVIRTFRERLGDSFVAVDAADRFLGRLARVREPERKRKIVGEEFVRVFEEQATRLGVSPGGFLIQGTLYPDVIESGGVAGLAAVIKSHHNVGGLPERMSLGLVEPLRNLFKDEVRAAGEELGLPPEIVWRQPFPGPGLAIRIIGPVTRTKLAVLREADAVVREEVERAGLGAGLGAGPGAGPGRSSQGRLWQYFAVLPGVRSVGVMGDERTYSYTIIVRAVTSEDGMTADWARLPHDLLERIASRIISSVPGVNRVAYDVTSKPPSTIEWE